MSKTWFTSDTHFGSGRTMKLSKRPFKTIKDMDNTIIDKRRFILKKLKMFSMFSGVGAYEKALENLGIEFKVTNYCEILKEKSKAYSLIHDISEEKNLWDAKSIDSKKLEDFDLFAYSPPCQSFSVSGNREGTKDIRGTLFYDALKVIEAKNPRYCIMENVDNLVNEFDEDFGLMCDSIKQLGYNNYWKVINANEFIPQNRNRVFLVSIREDVDDGEFVFPSGSDDRHWRDVIDLTDTRGVTKRQQRMVNVAKGVNKEDEIKLEGEVQFDDAVITLRQSGLRFQSNREYPTIVARYGTGGGNFTMIATNGDVVGITPKNCFLLMGFDAEDSQVLTDNKVAVSNQYIMAGDSVCVPVLEAIFTNLFKL